MSSLLQIYLNITLDFEWNDEECIGFIVRCVFLCVSVYTIYQQCLETSQLKIIVQTSNALQMFLKYITCRFVKTFSNTLSVVGV